MCVLLIKRLLWLVGRWARKPVNHTSWVALVTPTDRPKSVRNRCLIELFCGVVCVVTLPFWHFCWCRGFCHRTESDLFLFLPRIFVKRNISPGLLRWSSLQTKEGQRHTEFHLVGFENSQTPSTTTVWPSDHREDYRSCAWPLYSLVQTFPKALHSD